MFVFKILGKVVEFFIGLIVLIMIAAIFYGLWLFFFWNILPQLLTN